MCNPRRGWTTGRRRESRKVIKGKSTKLEIDFIALWGTLPSVKAASWWEFEDVLAPFFWIWPVGYLVQSREGVIPWIKEAPPIWMIPQRQENDPSASLKVDNKMIKLVARGYITEGVILSLKSFFSVPKGTDDIRMVFNVTVSGLNDSLWDPNLILPSMGSFLMMACPETHVVDLDVGEMFITFNFHRCWPIIEEWIWDPI